MVNKYQAVGFVSGLFGSGIVTPIGTAIAGGSVAVLSEKKKTKDFGYGMLYGAGAAFAVAAIVVVAAVVTAPQVRFQQPRQQFMGGYPRR